MKPIRRTLQSFAMPTRYARCRGAYCALACLAALLQTAPALAKQATFPCLATVDGERVNIRCGPSTNHFQIARLEKNSQVVVRSQRGDWYEIHLPSYEKCWIAASYVQPAGADPNGIPLLKLVGTSVNLRPSAGTKHTPIGKAGLQDVLRSAEQVVVVEDQKWQRIFAPLSAHAWIHKDYLKLGSAVQLQQVPHLVRKFGPGQSTIHLAGTSGTDPKGTGTPHATHDAATSDPKNTAKKPVPPASLQLPSVVSRRLRSFYDALALEMKKDPAEWQLDSMLTELARIRTTSEDEGEKQLAQIWDQHIRQNFLPFAHDMAEYKRNAENAVAKFREGERKEKDLHKEIDSVPRPGAKYLAKGWILQLGKNADIGATHKLMKGNRLLFYLKSDTIDLNRLLFKRVGVLGIMKDVAAEPGARMINVTGFDVLSK